MKIVVISDSHGNIANLKHVLGFTRKIKAGAVIHCGDWDNLAAVETVLACKIPLYAVLGNADIDERIENSLRMQSKKFNKKFLEVEIDGRKIGVVHSIKYLVSGIKYLSILFAGHRHYKGGKTINGVKIINPGALHSIKPSFAVYETDTNEVEFINL